MPSHRLDDAAPPGNPVARRRVYYLAGFDTRSARFYHQFYREEARRQQAVNGCRYEVGDCRPSGERVVEWTVRRHDAADGAEVETDYVFLAWNDQVHAHWPRSTLRVAASALPVYLGMIGNGVIPGTWRLSRPFFWMLVLPLLYTLAALGFAALGAAGAAALAGVFGLTGWWPMAAGLTGAIAGAAAGLVLSERQRVYWLLRAWAFILKWGRNQLPALDERWQQFADRIEADRRTDPVAETLIVGHSAGAMAAISVAERWLALQPPGGVDTSIKLMTIGSATPVLGLIPEAHAFRAQIAAVGRSPMPWIEFTAPADPLCYALVDPFTSCGVEVPPRADYRVKSARFDRMFDPAVYRRIRRDFFRIHFQYLCATVQPVENDYFTLTAGPRALRIEPAPVA